MKIKLAVLIAGIFGGLLSTANAQNLTLYGVVDNAVEYVNKANNQGNSRIAMTSTSAGLANTRLGVRGYENLGDDSLKAIFTIEAGFGGDTGKSGQGGRLFGRQAWVGLEGKDWGKISFGRQYTAAFYALMDSDVIGPATFSLASLDNYIPNARHDNSVVYQGKFSNVSVVGTYSLGRDTADAGGPAASNCAGESATDSSACRQMSALLKYSDENFGVGIAYDVKYGGAGATTPPGNIAIDFTSSDDKDERFYLNGFYKFDSFKLGAGWINRSLKSNAKPANSIVERKIDSDLFYVGLSYRITPNLALDTEVGHLIIDRKNHAPKAKSTLVVSRLSYEFSKRTAIYGLVGHMSNNETATSGLSGGQSYILTKGGIDQTGVAFGIKHSF